MEFSIGRLATMRGCVRVLMSMMVTVSFPGKLRTAFPAFSTSTRPAMCPVIKYCACAATVKPPRVMTDVRATAVNSNGFHMVPPISIRNSESSTTCTSTRHLEGGNQLPGSREQITADHADRALLQIRHYGTSALNPSYCCPATTARAQPALNRRYVTCARDGTEPPSMAHHEHTCSGEFHSTHTGSSVLFRKSNNIEDGRHNSSPSF